MTEANQQQLGIELARTVRSMATHKNHAEPRTALELLDQLEELGFPLVAFRIVHHLGERGETIHSFRSYCQRIREFRDGTNTDVVRRLDLVLAMYKGAGLTVSSPALFLHLARAAVEQVPFNAPTHRQS